MKEITKNFQKEFKLFSNQAKDAIKELFSKKGYRQIPNILSMSRGIAPFIVIPFFIIGNIPALIISEIIFVITDCFDGFIARKCNLISEFGKKLDTICDKIFAITLLIPISSIIPNIGIIIGFELVIAIINSNSVLKGNNPTSSYIGKFKTVLLSISIILGYMNMTLSTPISIVEIGFAISAVAQAYTAIDYYQIDKEKDKKKKIIEEKIDINEVKKINDSKKKQIQ